MLHQTKNQPRRRGERGASVLLNSFLRALRVSAVCLSLCAASAGAAEPVIYGPDGAPTVVQRKLYTMTGRWEVGLSGATAMSTPLLFHYGGTLQITRHPNEWLDAGVELAFNATGLSSLADQVREKLGPRADSTTQQGIKNDEIANASQMRMAAMAIVRLAPFYGKFNLASEVKVHFQAYGFAGAGVGFFRHESINICGTAGTAACGPASFMTTDNHFSFLDTDVSIGVARPAGQVGGGLRFYLNDQWSLRTEVHAYLFPDTFREAADLTQPASGADKTYLGLLTTFAAGLSVMF